MSDGHDDSKELSLEQQLAEARAEAKSAKASENIWWKYYQQEEKLRKEAQEEIKNLKSELAELKIEMASMKYEIIDAKADERVSANSIHTMQSTIRIILQEAIDGTARNS